MNKGGTIMAKVLKADLEREIENYKNIVSKNYETIQELLTENQQLKSVQKHNERNAGRPKKYGEEKISEITTLFLQKKSIRAIAKETGCSVGFVHKIINERHRENKE